MPSTKYPREVSTRDKAACCQGASYENFHDLPFRSPEEYRCDGEASLHDTVSATDSGVKGVSPFACLSTISIPLSSPFDVMHLVSLNFVHDLCALLNGIYFSQTHLNNHDGRMEASQWEMLGNEMSKLEAPVSWGHPPRDIAKHILSFKAEELSNFLAHYMLPLVFRSVNVAMYRALQSLVLVTSIATSYEITHEEIQVMDHHFAIFLKWYYNTFYQGDYDRLQACKYTIHGLLHLI